MPPHTWSIAEPDVTAVLARHARPLETLAAGEIPAIVLRGIWSASQCRQLVQRLIERGLLYDPRQSIPEHLREVSVPEGYYREGKQAAQAWTAGKTKGRERIDIGSSLGYRGSDREAFLAHSADSHRIFQELFGDAACQDNPIDVLYQCLQSLSVTKRVVTAHEPDGRSYSPAIIRAHYGGYTYKPHFDSVRLREKRSEYAVSAFEHQFAGVLVLQNATRGDQSAQCVIHRCLWTPDLDPVLKSGGFDAYARQHGVEHQEVRLEPGDLYFFNTRCIHEVPGLAGEGPRIVLATFIGFDEGRDEIFVWS